MQVSQTEKIFSRRVTYSPSCPKRFDRMQEWSHVKATYSTFSSTWKHYYILKNIDAKKNQIYTKNKKIPHIQHPQLTHKLAITVKVPLCPEVARTRLSTSRNMHVIKREITATSLSTQNIVVASLARRRAPDILHGDILDLDAIRRLSRWATVEVVLLNINTIDGDILQKDILEQNIRNGTRSV